MTVLDRNFGVFTATTGISVTRSTATAFGTGTVLVVAVFGNTVFTTPGGWTQRHNSVVNLGLYAYDRATAGETSFSFTCSTGSGQWYSWELSAGSTYVTGNLAQAGSSTNYVTTAITPTAGNRHLLALGGGTNPSTVLSVSSFSNSFTLGSGGQAQATDWPFSARAERDMTNDGTTSVSTTATFSAISAGSSGGGMLAYINNAGDATPPTVPTGLTTTAIGSTTADLSWSAATDDTAVTGYELQIIGP